MSSRKKNVTAKDIARACGLSQATVSYVMNNKEGKKISEATRRLVLQTARELNYIPNSTARSMRTNRSMSIGVVTGWNNLSMGFSLVLRGGQGISGRCRVFHHPAPRRCQRQKRPRICALLPQRPD